MRYQDVLYALELGSAAPELARGAPEEAIPLVARAREIAKRLEFWMESGEKSYVYWIEKARPLDVSSSHADRRVAIARHVLFDSIDTVILTATLSLWRADSNLHRNVWDCEARGRWWFRARSITQNRRCSTFRRICPTRATRPSRVAPPGKSSSCSCSRAAGRLCSSPATSRCG